jgi:hypothetical protein
MPVHLTQTHDLIVTGMAEGRLGCTWEAPAVTQAARQGSKRLAVIRRWSGLHYLRRNAQSH